MTFQPIRLSDDVETASDGTVLEGGAATTRASFRAEARPTQPQESASAPEGDETSPLDVLDPLIGLFGSASEAGSGGLASLFETAAAPTAGGAGIALLEPERDEPPLPVAAASDPLQVRAPDVLEVSALAVWDGKRTARGVWVAHPELRGPMQVRLVNGDLRREVDGVVYRHSGQVDAGDILTVSSDAAEALGMEPGEQAQIAVYALKSADSLPADRTQRSKVENRARQELASHIARMPENALLQLAAAAVRGMGYTTSFKEGSGDDPTMILAFARPDDARKPAPVRVTVRTGDASAVSPAEVAAMHAALGDSVETGMIVSIAGFADGAAEAAKVGEDRVELLDLEEFLDLWIRNYPQLSEPDRAFLRLQPVYFLAGN